MSDERTTDNSRFESWLGAAGAAIAVPDDGAATILELAHERIGNVDGASSSTIGSRATFDRAKRWQVVAACAAVLTLMGGTLAALTGQTSKSAVRAERVPPGAQFGYSRGRVADAGSSVVGATRNQSLSIKTSATNGFSVEQRSAHGTTGADSPKLEKNGSIDVQLVRGSLTAQYRMVRTIATANGGYLADGKTDEAGDTPSASATIRVPVERFDAAVDAIAHIGALRGNKVVNRTSSSRDVTASYADLHARLQAATSERDQVSLVLTKAQTIGDILAVRDRLNSVQTEVDQLQGQINVLDDQTSYAAVAVSLHEQPAPLPKPVGPAKLPKPATGLVKAWDDARHGFSHSVEWFVARSGKALVILGALLAMLFLARYLYPVVRRGLL